MLRLYTGEQLNGLLRRKAQLRVRLAVERLRVDPRLARGGGGYDGGSWEAKLECIHEEAGKAEACWMGTQRLAGEIRQAPNEGVKWGQGKRRHPIRARPRFLAGKGACPSVKIWTDHTTDEEGNHRRFTNLQQLMRRKGATRRRFTNLQQLMRRKGATRLSGKWIRAAQQQQVGGKTFTIHDHYNVAHNHLAPRAVLVECAVAQDTHLLRVHPVIGPVLCAVLDQLLHRLLNQEDTNVHPSDWKANGNITGHWVREADGRNQLKSANK
eukprot:3077872-Pleurochrysis_carterae.AAC.1